MSWFSRNQNSIKNTKPKKPRVEPQDVLEKVVNQLDILGKRADYLEKQSKKERDEAQKFARAKNTPENVRKAKDHLKRSKQHDAVATKIHAVADNLQALQDQIVEAISMESIIPVMQQANDLLKDGICGMSEEDIVDLHEDIATTLDEHRAAMDALAQPLGPQFDADELDRELGEFAHARDEDEEVETAPVHHGRVPEPRDEQVMIDLLSGLA
jgi:hypothetical protein